MSKTVKSMIAAELHERYKDFSDACLVDMTGMDVQEQEAFRGRLRKSHARVEVVKNSLARRAFKGGPLDPLGAAMVGPCALVTSSDSLIEVAKVLVEAARDFGQLKLKHALIEGGPDLMTVEELARMKSRSELLGEVSMLVMAPARAVASCIGAPQSKIAGCLKTIVDRAA